MDSASNAPEPVLPVSHSTRVGAAILAAAVLLGLLLDQLSIVWPIGLGATLGVLLLAAAAPLVARLTGVRIGAGAWLLAPIAVAAIFLAVRDSGTLTVLNILAIAVCGALLLHRLRGGNTLRDGLGDYALAGILSTVAACVSVLFVVFSDVAWRELAGLRWSRVIAPVARGIIIAVPLVLVFGLLFISADPAFERIVTDILRIDLRIFIRDVLVSLMLAWVAAGLLRQALLARERPALDLECPAGLRLGGTEMAIILGLLDLLFLSFVIVQLQWLFGGQALVASSPTLTYSEYARRGFFELVIVALLVLPLVLLGDWLLRRGSRRDVWLSRSLTIALLALLGVVMASAVNRMLLYQSAYGLTELRLYPTAFMAWLALVFVWFCATVLRDRRDRFAVGSLVSALLILLALNVMNPDALIVRVNSERADAASSFDATYAKQMSADAVPALVAALPRLRPDVQTDIARALWAKWAVSDPYGWRSWQLGRDLARREIGKGLVVKY